jgi:RNA polymerase primary sigma factor
MKYLKDIISLSNGTFIFTQLSETNQRIGDILVKSGLSIETLDGSDSSKIRNEVLNRFKTKQIHGIAAPMILDQGIDVPSADLAIITGRSKSRRQMIQRIGRVVRRKEDNGMGKIIILISKGTIDDPDTNDNDAFYDVFEDTNIVIKRLEYEGNPALLIKKIEEWNND